MKYSFLVAIIFCACQTFAQDLTIVRSNVPASGKRYQPLTGKVSIHSETAIAQYIHTYARLSTDTIWDNNDKYIGGSVVSAIGADEVKEVDVLDGIEQFGLNAAPGDYYLVFKVDFAEVIAETDEKNNFLAVPFTVLPASVDLAFGDVTKSGDLVGKGGVLDVTYEIKSLSTDHVSSVYTQFYLTRGGPNDARIWESFENYNMISWNQSRTYQTSVAFDGDIPGGVYTLYGEIQNYGQEVTLVETNVDNNVVNFGDITVDGAELDLALGDFMPVAFDERSFNYDLDFINNSATDVVGYGVRFIFSADAVLDESDAFVLGEGYSTHPSRRLAAGQTERKFGSTYQTSPEFFIPAGTWYVFAEINYGKELPETDYSNNIVRSLSTITIDPWTLEFESPPTINDITSTSLKINAPYSSFFFEAYYLILPAGSSTPDKNTILAENNRFITYDELLVTDLSPSTNYDVYIVGYYSYEFATDPYKISVTTLNGNSPAVTVPSDVITFKSVATGGVSSKRLYEVSALELTDSLKLSVVGNFRISKDNIVFRSAVAFSVDEINFRSKTVYVQFTTPDTSGVFSGRIIHSTAGGEDVEVALSVNVFEAVTGNFNDATSLEEVGWQVQNPLGSQTWDLSTDSGPGGRKKTENQVVRISGADGGIEANEDWLITPAMNLSTFIHNAELSFYSKSQGAGNSLQLKYSIDYVEGDPSSATWVDLNGDFPATNSNTWKRSSHIVLPKNENVHVAFVYTSTATQASTWMIDNWDVTENLFSISAFTMDFENTVSGSVSSPREFEMQFVGYGDITIVATEGFEVSVDNLTFTDELVVAANDMSASKTIYVRFAPTSPADLVAGKITISGADFSVQRDVQGSSPAPMATEKGAEKIFALYPNPTTGNVSIAWYVPASAGISVKVITAQGIVVKTFRATTNNLSASLSAFLESAPAGVYQVQLADGSRNYVTRVVKN